MKRFGFNRQVKPKPPETEEERAERKQAQARAAMQAAVPRAASMGGNTGNSVSAIPKGIKAKPGKTAPTKEEREWMDAIVQHGCIACILDGHAPRPTAVHHILSGGVRMGHMQTLPLCDPGHHQGGEALGLVSRHPWKTRFEQRYGDEGDLLALMHKRLNWSVRK